MFVVDLLLLALSAMVFPNPGMQGVFIHPEVTGGLGNGLIRIDCQFHRTFLECGGVFFHRSLAHRTHLVCCVSSLSPCVRESIATSPVLCRGGERAQTWSRGQRHHPHGLWQPRANPASAARFTREYHDEHLWRGT